MTLDQIIDSEALGTRAIQHGAAMADDTHTLASVAAAMAILAECRQFATTMAQAAALTDIDRADPDYTTAHSMKAAALARLAAYLTPRG